MKRRLVESDLEAISQLFDDLPEGCMPIDGVVILQYLDPDGETRITFRTTDSYHSHSIGMLYMAQWQLMNIGENDT